MLVQLEEEAAEDEEFSKWTSVNLIPLSSIKL